MVFKLEKNLISPYTGIIMMNKITRIIPFTSCQLLRVPEGMLQ